MRFRHGNSKWTAPRAYNYNTDKNQRDTDSLITLLFKSGFLENISSDIVPLTPHQSAADKFYANLFHKGA